MSKVSIKVILGAVILIGCGLAIGCGGSTDGGSAADDNGQGTQFDPSNVGSISLTVVQDPVQVAEVVGFFAEVKDSSGAGVPLTRVSCDTEKGVAIIEPTTGAEITDAGGRISGKIGCVSPGSYLFGCRVPVGANKRTFVTVHCAPPIPAGFDGFPGAAGGGLGTGGNSQNGNGGNGGSSLDGVTIASVTLNDGGGAGTAIDTVQNLDCNNDGSATTTDIEPFFDTTIAVVVNNNTNQSITFSSYSYSIDGVFQSDDIAFAGGTVAAGGDTILSSLFAKANSNGSKSFITSSTPIDEIGVQNIQVSLHGTTDSGDDVLITSSTVASFDDYDNCSGQ